MARFVYLSLAILASLEVAYGYGSGAPKDACGDMIPQHHVEPQKTAFPYIITASKKSIRPGDKVTIIISSSASVKDFQGFFVQARVADSPVGKFAATDGVKVIDCGSGKENAATHVKPDGKSKIAIQWTAPPSLTETVRFYATVAKNGGEFWVKQVGPILSVRK